MILVYTTLSLVIFWLIGLFVLQTLRIGDRRVKSNPLYPVAAGFCFSLSMLMTIGSIIPVRIVSIALIAVAVGYFVINAGRVYGLIVHRLNLHDKVLLLITVIPMTVAGLPQVWKDELFISVLWNNDCGYYISSIDWLKSHALLNSVEYSVTYPFYSLADYMLKTTRIGTDVAGAFLANVFHLESYQVFPVIAVLSIILIMISVYEVVNRFSGNQLLAMIIAVLAAVSGNSIALIGGQYVPQLLGISLLLLSLYEVDSLFCKQNKETIILTGLTLSGLVATYCEFVVYLVPFCIIYSIYFLVKRELHIIGLLKAAAVTILFNIYAFIRAIKFLQMIFSRVNHSGLTDIDAKGTMIEIQRLFCMLFGVPDDWGMPSVLEVHQAYYVIGILAVLITVFFVLLLAFRQKTGKGWRLFVVWMIIFISYELYFRLSGGGYTEYKHVSSGYVLFFCMAGCVLSRIPSTGTVYRFGQIGLITGLGCYVIAGLINPVRNSIESNVGIDHTVMELRNSVDQIVPENVEIEIDDAIPIMAYMGAACALKDRPLNLNSKSISYLQYFNVFDDNDPSKYILCSKETETSCSFKNDAEIVWMNEKYLLLKRNTGKQYQYMDIISGGFCSDSVMKKSALSHYVENGKGKEGYVLYGPYVSINGKYEIILEYTVPQGANEGGIFDVYSKGEVLKSIRMDPQPGTHKIRIPVVQFNDNSDVEFRVYAEEGYSVKIDSLKYRSLDAG